MATHTHAIGVTAGGAALAYEVALTADSETNLSLAIADSTTDGQVVLSVDQSAVVGLFLYSDQTVTIETNDGTTPDDTITLTAETPIQWYTNCGHANPITTDITTDIYITNSSGSTANIEIRVLQDSTP